LAARGAAWAWALFAVTLGARLAVAVGSAAGVLGDPQWRRDIFLLPVRDLIAPVVWGLSFFGSKILWRGDWFHLKDGRLTAVSRAAGR
jgi:ceramide glucosyltransferase